jgi:hypothetical protein
MRQITCGAALLFLAMRSLQAVNVAGATEPLNNHWLVPADLHGTPLYGRLDIELQGQKITSEYYGDEFEGSLGGSAIHFVAKDSSGGASKIAYAARGKLHELASALKR